jgi:hypothetical protein
VPQRNLEIGEHAQLLATVRRAVKWAACGGGLQAAWISTVFAMVAGSGAPSSRKRILGCCVPNAESIPRLSRAASAHQHPMIAGAPAARGSTLSGILPLVDLGRVEAPETGRLRPGGVFVYHLAVPLPRRRTKSTTDNV